MTGIFDVLVLGKQLDELYEFLKKVTADFNKYKENKDNEYIKQLLVGYRKGVAETEHICTEIIAAHDVSKEMGVFTPIMSEEERSVIAGKFKLIAQELKNIANIPTFYDYVGIRPDVGKAVQYQSAARNIIADRWYVQARATKRERLLLSIPFGDPLMSDETPFAESGHDEIKNQELFISHIKKQEAASARLINILNEQIDKLG